MKSYNCTALFLLILQLTACGSSSDSSTGSDNSELTPEQDVVVDTPETSTLLPDHIPASLIFDADSDGDLDLLVASGTADAKTQDVLLINDGSGHFEAASQSLPQRYLAEDGISVSFSAADFNGDGNDDILAIATDDSYANSQLQLFIANGDGSFTDKTTQITTNELENWPSWTRIADFNNDGALDFILATTGCSTTTTTTDTAEDCYGGRIYLNDGLANFSPTTVTTYDNYQTNENVSKIIWPGGGDTRLDATSFRVALDVLVGDMDNDGDTDIVGLNGSAPGPIVTLLNESTEDNLKFKIIYYVDASLGDEYLQNQVSDGTLIDINHDGFLDLVASQAIGEGSPMYAYLNNGYGTFTADDTALVFDTTPPSYQHLRQWLVSDFNNDGFDDIFIADHGNDWMPFAGNTNILLLGDSEGKLIDYSTEYLSADNTFTHGASSGDVNGDGYEDLFLNNWSDLADGGDRLIINNAGQGFIVTDITE